MAVGLVLKDPPCGVVERIAPLAERRGYSHLLFPELSIPGTERFSGRDPFVSASIALQATSALRAGPAVAGTIFHTPRHLALRAATVHEQSAGRFVLGCGVSHRAYADELGVPFPAAPLTHARDYCAGLRTIADRLAFGRGFPVWLAALGDRMVEAAADAADGVVLNWVSPAWLRRTAVLAREGAGAGFTVAVLLRVGPRAALEGSAGGYTAMFEHYARHFARQGLHRPEDVVDQTCVPLEGLAGLPDRMQAYRDAGADLVCVYPADIDAGEISDLVDRLGDWT